MSAMTLTAPENSVRTSRVGRRRTAQRRGAIVVLTALLLVMMLVFIAFAVDVGLMMTARTQTQRAVDSGALAAAGVLATGESDPTETAREYVLQNNIYGAAIAEESVEVDLGDWEENTRTFIEANDREHITAVRVKARAEDRPLFFGLFAGSTAFDTEAESIATFQPRDIVLVLDCSGSMNDDSEFQQIGQLGRSYVENNQYQIYQELGSPQFGNMTWQPRSISSSNTNTVMNQLGLNGVPYPYPGGSWSDYISYVQNSSSVNSAGYRKKYGYLTFIQYLLEQRESYSETPSLWQTSEQPITAVKNSTSILLAYIREVKADDRVGLSLYTHPNGGALLASDLTYDLDSVESLSRQVQAGHYEAYTNIAAGLREAREEMDENARVGALKLIVLITDGQANRPSNNAFGAAIDQAELCADSGYVVLTISLGADADTNLMQQIADITGGIHFNVPGGQSVASYEEQLKDVFRQIASQRPLRIVE